MNNQINNKINARPLFSQLCHSVCNRACLSFSAVIKKIHQVSQIVTAGLTAVNYLDAQYTFPLQMPHVPW